jgi:hypothetical protein
MNQVLLTIATPGSRYVASRLVDPSVPAIGLSVASLLLATSFLISFSTARSSAPGAHHPSLISAPWSEAGSRHFSSIFSEWQCLSLGILQVHTPVFLIFVCAPVHPRNLVWPQPVFCVLSLAARCQFLLKVAPPIFFIGFLPSRLIFGLSCWRPFYHPWASVVAALRFRGWSGTLVLAPIGFGPRAKVLASICFSAVLPAQAFLRRTCFSSGAGGLDTSRSQLVLISD